VLRRNERWGPRGNFSRTQWADAKKRKREKLKEKEAPNVSFLATKIPVCEGKV